MCGCQLCFQPAHTSSTTTTTMRNIDSNVRFSENFPNNIHRICIQFFTEKEITKAKVPGKSTHLRKILEWTSVDLYN